MGNRWKKRVSREDAKAQRKRKMDCGLPPFASLAERNPSWSAGKVGMAARLVTCNRIHRNAPRRVVAGLRVVVVGCLRAAEPPLAVTVRLAHFPPERAR